MNAIVVPCFNEESRFDLQYWIKIIDEVPNCYWLFVNDGSSDGTAILLRKISRENVRVIDLEENVGKGEAIRAGFEIAINESGGRKWTSFGYIDSDGAFAIDDILDVVQKSSDYFQPDSGFKAVIGSRVKLAGRKIDRSLTRHYLGRMIATYICFGWKLAPYDTQSGFKIFHFDAFFEEAVKQPFRTSWFFDIELMLRLENRQSFKAWEIPVNAWFEIGQSRIRKRSIFIILLEIYRIRNIVKSSLQQMR
jgi:dolichyl-phosphate beta-glucosyltransferase